jgi:hypothetical protein
MTRSNRIRRGLLREGVVEGRLKVAALRAVTLALRFSGDPAGTIMVAVVADVADGSLTPPRVEHAEIGRSPPSKWVHRLGPERQARRSCVPGNVEILVRAPAEPHAHTVPAYSSAFELELTGRAKQSTAQPNFALASGFVARRAPQANASVHAHPRRRSSCSYVSA